MYANGHMIWMAMWWAFDLIVVAVVLWLLFSAFRGGSAPMNETAEDILKRRLAAGEIDIEEYGRRLTALSKTKNAA